MMDRGLTRRQLLAISAGTLATWLAELPSRLEASSAAATQGKPHSPKTKTGSAPGPGRGMGALTFQDVTPQVLGQQPQAAGWPYICVLDFDNDGWPDLLVGHQADFDQPVGSIDAPITGPYPYGAQVFKNNRNGTFTEMTSYVLPRPVRNQIESYWVFIAGDMDGDGVVEVFAGTDYGIPNGIWKTNTSPWTDVAPAWGMTDPASGPGAATFIRGEDIGGDPNTLALVFSNFTPPRASGAVPLWYVWRRVNGTWQRSTTGVDHIGNWWTNDYQAGVQPYAIQFARFPNDPTGARVAGIETGINQQMWMHFFPGNPVPWGDQNQSGAWKWADLSAYSHDTEIVDVNNDGVLDLVMSDYIDFQTVTGLRVVLGSGGSIPSPAADGPQGGSKPYPYTSWFTYTLNEPQALAVGDFDNDGFVDVFLLTGAYGGGQPRATKQPDFLGHNNGDGTFTNVTAGSGDLEQYVGQWYTGSGAVVIDYDLDGKLDLVVGYNGPWNYTNADGVYFQGGQGPYKVYRNTTQNPGNFIGFALPVNSDVGSTITISGAGFGPRKIQLTARTGWMRQSQRLVHFGLGAFPGPVDVRITRPDGTYQTYTGLLVNHYWRITGGRPLLLT